MSGGGKTPKRKSRIAGFVLSLATLAALAYVVIMLIMGRDLGLDRILKLFTPREKIEWADEQHFDNGRARAFANLDGAVASAGTLGIQVIGYGGGETLRDAFRMTEPAIRANAGRAVAFDVGGKAVRVFDAKGIAAAFDANGAIVAASINENGWFCVCVQDAEGYMGIVTVYDDAGKDAYRVRVANGYVLSAALSPDNRKLAILTLVDDGSKIAYYSLDSEDTGGPSYMHGGLILGIRYLPGGDVLAISTDSLVIVDSAGTGREIYGFNGKRLGGYVLDGSPIAVHLLDYGMGYNGRLVTFGDGGEQLGMIATYREIVSMSSSAGMVAALRGDGLMLYDAALGEIPQANRFESATGIDKVLALGADAVLVTGEYTAKLVLLANG